MKAIAIMYHDVVENGDFAASGFAGADADIYKLDKNLFSEHLTSIKNEQRILPVSAFDLNEPSEKNLLMITFDDGGRSAYTHIADELEKFGWRGHFFVATDFINSPSFLNINELRELHERGHIIGSHSASHPLRMAACTRQKMADEWRISIEKLSGILGASVKIASVPGGHFSKKVAETAAENGIEILFNSEPVTRINRIGNCKIIGRYTIQHKMSAHEIAAIVRGEISPRLRQYALWNAKKGVKKIGGNFYLNMRKRFLSKK